MLLNAEDLEGWLAERSGGSSPQKAVANPAPAREADAQTNAASTRTVKQNAATLLAPEEDDGSLTDGSGMSHTARPQLTTIITGADEDADALASTTEPANTHIAGHWIIAQAIAWIIYGDPGRSLPERGSDQQHLLDEAERILAADFQMEPLTLSGRRQSKFDVQCPEPTPRTEIPRPELLGLLIFNRTTPVAESWLFVRDPETHRPRHIWKDVLIREAQLRALHPKPLVASFGAAPASCSEFEAAGRPAAAARDIDGGAVESPVTAEQFVEARDPLPLLVQWAQWKYGGRDLPGRNKLLEDHRARFGRIPRISDKAMRLLRKALASDTAKLGGAPTHQARRGV